MIRNFFNLKKSVNFFSIAIVLFLSLIVQSCREEDGPELMDELSLKSEVISTGNTLVWGSETITISPGRIAATATFKIGSSGLDYFDKCLTLHVKNGNSSATKVASAIILVDGVLTVRAVDFLKKPSRIIKEICSVKESTTIDIVVFGKQGSNIEIWIEGILKPEYMKDARDGRFYKVIKIGTQTWMAENLAFLPSLSPPESSSETSPHFYVYGYSGSSLEEARNSQFFKFNGVLYNWPAAMNGMPESNLIPSGVRGICPAGWHLPSDAEWTLLFDYLENNGFGYEGSGNDIAKSLASKTGWSTTANFSNVPGNNPENNNSSGFNAYPAGAMGNGIFHLMGRNVIWQTTSMVSPGISTRVTQRYLQYDLFRPGRSVGYQISGVSVRCLKD